MTNSCNFADDETCYLLASLIDKAPKLNHCNYSGHDQIRKIKAELKVPETGIDGAPGYIKIIADD